MPADGSSDRIAEIKSLNTILALLLEAETVQDMFIPMFSDILAWMECEAGLLHVADLQAGILTLEADEGINDALRQKCATVEVGLGPVGQAAKTRRITSIDNVDQFEGRVRGFWEDSSLKSSASVPVAAAAGVVAVLTLGTARADHFDNDRLKKLEQLRGRLSLGADRVCGSAAADDGLAGLKSGRDPLVGLLDVMAEGVLLADARGTIITTNHGLENITGNTRMDLQARSLAQVLPGWLRMNDTEEDHKMKLKVALQLEENLPLTPKEVTFINMAGEEYNAVIEVVHLKAGPTSPYSQVATVRRMTGALETGNRMWQVNALARTLIESAPFGVIGTDLEGTVTHASRTALGLLGLKDDQDIVGSSLEEYVAPHDKGSILKTVGDILRESRVSDVECRLQRRGGPLFPAALTGGLVTDDDGNPESALLILQDITRLKEAEGNARKGGILDLHDPLTGFYSRDHFHDELERMGKDIGRFLPMTLFVIEIDGAELVNEIFGRDLLMSSAEIVSRPFRKTDTLSRIGGDRFAVVTPHTNFGVAMAKRSHILQMIKKFNQEHQTVPLSVSIGLATAGAAGEGSAFDLLRRSEQDLHDSKTPLKEGTERKAFDRLWQQLANKGLLTPPGGDPFIELVKNTLDKLDITLEEAANIRGLARAHNMGYIAVPEGVLEKPTTLTPDEFALVKKHPQVSYNIALKSKEFTSIASLVLHHHERWDGGGYPAGLKGERIPLECRLFAVLDAFNALISPRPYREAMERDQALAELLNGSGTQFDPSILDELISLLE
ncbi:HD domain-containing phosphohydrolase [Planctomycetota bacterium]